MSENKQTWSDLAIDGAIYTLLGDGRVHKYVNGAPVAFDESGTTQADQESVDARSLYTSPTAGLLLITDRKGGRILVRSPDGSAKGQLLRPAQRISTDEVARSGRFATLHDVWWHEDGETLYIAAGDALLQAPYGLVKE